MFTNRSGGIARRSAHRLLAVARFSQPIHSCGDGAPYHDERLVYKCGPFAENNMGQLRLYPPLSVVDGVKIVLSRRYFVTPLTRPSWSRFFKEFTCWGCGGHAAYHSRARGFFEKHVLRFLLLQPVRCDRCYHRAYVVSTIPALKRPQLAERKKPNGEPSGGSKPNRNVA